MRLLAFRFAVPFAVLLVLGALAVAPVRAQGGRPLPAIEDYAGAWAGSYIAMQGVTNVVVSVVPDSDSTFTGRFIFFAHPDYPDTPTGSYTISGFYDWEEGGAVFVGDAWIEQPPNYIFVALGGLYDPDDAAWKGEVFMEGGPNGNERVGTFRLERIY